MINFLVVFSSNNNIKNLLTKYQKGLKNNNIFLKDFGELLLIHNENKNFQ